MGEVAAEFISPSDSPMYSHEYSKELSLKTNEKKVPFGIALAVFALFAVACWFGYSQLKPHLRVSTTDFHSH